MRTIRASRNLGDSRAADVQIMINERPVTVDVYRPAPSQRHDSLSRPKVATFQARIDPYRQSFADVRNSTAGDQQDITFLLTSCYTKDVNNATIDFKQDDEIVTGGKTYVVAAKVPYPSYKLEGILRLT